MRYSLNLVLPIGVQKEIQPWLDQRTAMNLSPYTIHFEREILLQIAAFLWADHGVERLHDARPRHLEAWHLALYARKLTKASVAKRLPVAKSFYGWLEKQGDIFENPAKGLIIPKYQRPLQWVPSEAQMLALLLSIKGDSAVDLRDRAFLEVAYATGFRRRELVSMNLDSLDLLQGTARIVGKGQRERVIPLTRAAIAACRLYLDKARPVLLRDGEWQHALWLSDHANRRVCAHSLPKQLERRGLKLGLVITLHAIRRAFATHLLRGGAPVAQIKELLGHSSYQHIGHYLRYAPMELQAVHRKSRLGR